MIPLLLTIGLAVGGWTATTHRWRPAVIGLLAVVTLWPLALWLTVPTYPDDSSVAESLATGVVFGTANYLVGLTVGIVIANAVRFIVTGVARLFRSPS